MDKPTHTIQMLLMSYNRQCPDCRLSIMSISEPRARRILAEEASRSPVRQQWLQNAISIWQQAAKRKNAKGAR